MVRDLHFQVSASEIFASVLSLLLVFPHKIARNEDVRTSENVSYRKSPSGREVIYRTQGLRNVKEYAVQLPLKLTSNGTPSFLRSLVT